MALRNTKQWNRASVQKALWKCISLFSLCNKLQQNLEAHNKLQDADYVIWARSPLCRGFCCSQCLTGPIQWEQFCPICSLCSSRTSRINMEIPSHGDCRCEKANRPVPQAVSKILLMSHMLILKSNHVIWLDIVSRSKEVSPMISGRALLLHEYRKH